MTESDLLAGLVEHPEELDRWLILSDFLEDQEDPRAELARLHYELATRPQYDEREHHLTRRQVLLDSGLFPIIPAYEGPVGMQFVWCPPGFLKINGETIFVDGFWMGKTPVTQAQWYAVMGTEPSHFRGENHPVERVSWNDCQDFCRQFSAKMDLPVRLPTEAQWEYACRVGTQTTFWWGDDAGKLGDHAWCAKNAGMKTHPVGTKRPNAWGLFDMYGNVWEWCEDEYTTNDSSRVLRGGAWYCTASFYQTTYRNDRTPEYRSYGMGFRVCFRLD